MNQFDAVLLTSIHTLPDSATMDTGTYLLDLYTSQIARTKAMVEDLQDKVDRLQKLNSPALTALKGFSKAGQRANFIKWGDFINHEVQLLESQLVVLEMTVDRMEYYRQKLVEAL